MTPPAACAAWLDELLSKLSDRPAHLVGFSYGGWVALNQAIRAPGRVASITLLDPAGLTKLDARFWWWLSISGLASMTPMPLRRRLARWLDSPPMAEQELMTLMWAAIRGYHAEPKFPDVLTDDDLRAIDVPVLLITGARSAMLTPAEARSRGLLMPSAEVVIVPGSHGGFNRIDALNDRIADFLKARATSTSQPNRHGRRPDKRRSALALQGVADRLRADHAAFNDECVNTIIRSRVSGIRRPCQQYHAVGVGLPSDVPPCLRQVGKELAEGLPHTRLAALRPGGRDHHGVIGEIGDDLIKVRGTKCLAVVGEHFLRRTRHRIPPVAHAGCRLAQSPPVTAISPAAP
jgi:dienelactone hydrolase